ncbi:MAG: flagellar M-ring protein FliF C-terminal domain-containing protein, partial [Pseudomonadota bacterium]
LGVGREKATTGDTPEITPVHLSKLEELVKQAVGFSAIRGDEVKVQAVPFAATKPKEAIPPTAFQKHLERVLDYKLEVLAALLGAGLLIGVILLLERQYEIFRVKKAAVVKGLPKTVRELEADLPKALKSGMGVEGFELPESRTRQLAYAAAESDPLRTAQVVRAWLAEG